MPIATGIVDNVDGKFISMGGTRYSAFAPTQIKCNAGDTVTFEYVEKHSLNKFGNPVVYNNIKGNVYGKGGPIPTPVAVSGYSGPASSSKVGEPILSKDRLILRQNALTAAVNFTKDAETITPEQVIKVAKIFEAYTSGDADLKEVEDALNTGASVE